MDQGRRLVESWYLYLEQCVCGVVDHFAVLLENDGGMFMDETGPIADADQNCQPALPGDKTPQCGTFRLH